MISGVIISEQGAGSCQGIAVGFCLLCTIHGFDVLGAAVSVDQPALLALCGRESNDGNDVIVESIYV